MIIADIKTHLLEHHLGTAFESASARFTTRSHLIVEVICEDGTTGWGECLGPAVLNRAMVAAYAPLFIGQSALDTERLWAEAYNRFRDQGQRGIAITVEAFDWNCSQHILPRFSARQLQPDLDRLTNRIAELEAELATRVSATQDPN